MGPQQQLIETCQRILLEPHRVEIQAHAGAVKHTHHHTFAMHRGHGGYTQIQLAPLHTGLNAPILRQTPLRDVKMGQQFDARTDGCRKTRRHNLAQMDHAIDAVTHMKAIVKRLQMDIGRAQVRDAPNDGVDQADHRRFARQVFQVLDEIAAIHSIGKTVITIRSRLLSGLCQRLLDIALQGEVGPDRAACDQMQRLQ